MPYPKNPTENDRFSPTIKQRFAKYVRPSSTGCLEWVGSKTPAGYGSIAAMADGKVRLAHRVAWRLHFGVWPITGLMHLCDNPACVKIEHLKEGSQKQNIEDAAGKGRMGRFSALTQDQMDTLCAKRKDGVRYAQLAFEFGISIATAHKICNGWAPSKRVRDP